MILMYLNYTFSNLYHYFISQKNLHFFLSKDEILVKKTPTSLHEKKTVLRHWTLILIFCVDAHMGDVILSSSHAKKLASVLPPSTCVHLSLTPYPLRVDVKWM